MERSFHINETGFASVYVNCELTHHNRPKQRDIRIQIYIGLHMYLCVQYSVLRLYIFWHFFTLFSCVCSSLVNCVELFSKA